MLLVVTCGVSREVEGRRVDDEVERAGLQVWASRKARSPSKALTPEAQRGVVRSEKCSDL